MRALIGLLFALVISASAIAATFSETFNDGAANGWIVPAGTWAVVSSTYRSTAIGASDISVYSRVKWYTNFTFRASIYNASDTQANQAGMVYNYVNTTNYYAVKFAPTGQAHLIRVIDGAQTTVASATYSGGGSDVWFDVEVTRSGNGTTVKVNGTTVFSNVYQRRLGPGRIGLITTFANARFNNVTVDSAAPFWDNFSGATATNWLPVGTWSVVSGTYRSTASGGADRAVYGAASWATGFVYRARIYHADGAEASQAGVVYNYVNSSNYYAVKFSPTGRAVLSKVIAGTETVVSSTVYSGGGSGVWFNAVVERDGAATTVKVNGITIFSNFVQDELGAGRVGLITAFASARFDRVVLSVTTPPPVDKVTFSCNFAGSGASAWKNCGFTEQTADSGTRATIQPVSRPEEPSFPAKAVRLHTKPEDVDPNLPPDERFVRNDLRLSDEASDCFHGQEQWWAHSVMFPGGTERYTPPNPGWYVVMDFHNTTDDAAQANFHVDSDRYDDKLHFRGYAGAPKYGSAPADYGDERAWGLITRDVWYDFVYHVKWSWGNDGYFRAWLRKGGEDTGRLVVNHDGPTLYTGQGCYLKLANYHLPSAADSYVIHSRLRRGTSASAVSLTLLAPLPQ